MLTLENYKAQTGTVNPFNEQQALELGRVGEGLAKKRFDSYSWDMGNRSERT